MKQFISLAIASCILVACNRSQPTPEATPQLNPISSNQTAKPTVGQTIYVPVYSHIYSPDRNQRMDLAVTLSIRNTDLTHSIRVTSVRYYNTSGTLIRNYVEQPGELKPLASAEFVVPKDDTSGGAGANFIVEWDAIKSVSDPIVESVMINTMGNQGVSFVSQGRVIKRQGNR